MIPGAFAGYSAWVLLLRGLLHLGGYWGKRRNWMAKALLEWAPLSMFEFGGGTILCGAASVLSNVLGYRLAAGGRIDRGLGHWALGVVHLSLIVIAFGPALELHVRPETSAWFSEVRQWLAFGPAMEADRIRRFQMILAGYLLATTEAQLLLRGILRMGQMLPLPDAPASIGLASGRTIGLLERTAIFALTLLGEYDGIGFVVAAKGLVRFRELEDRTFAEYFLVGTLLSVLMAMGAAALVRCGLAALP